MCAQSAKVKKGNFTLREGLQDSGDGVWIIQKDETLDHLDEVGRLVVAFPVQVDQLLQQLVPVKIENFQIAIFKRR